MFHWERMCLFLIVMFVLNNGQTSGNHSQPIKTPRPPAVKTNPRFRQQLDGPYLLPGGIYYPGMSPIPGTPPLAVIYPGTPQIPGTPPVQYIIPGTPGRPGLAPMNVVVASPAGYQDVSPLSVIVPGIPAEPVTAPQGVIIPGYNGILGSAPMQYIIPGTPGQIGFLPQLVLTQRSLNNEHLHSQDNKNCSSFSSNSSASTKTCAPPLSTDKLKSLNQTSTTTRPESNAIALSPVKKKVK